jgi:hypothetical protein
MADWTSIPDATFDPDRPVLGSTHLAIVKNFEALAEGASGAPRIETAAIAAGAITAETMQGSVAGSTVLFGLSGVTYTSGNTFESFISDATFKATTSCQVRVSAQYRVSGSFIGNVTLRVYKNGSAVLTQTKGTTSWWRNCFYSNNRNSVFNWSATHCWGNLMFVLYERISENGVTAFREDGSAVFIEPTDEMWPSASEMAGPYIAPPPPTDEEVAAQVRADATASWPKAIGRSLLTPALQWERQSRMGCLPPSPARHPRTTRLSARCGMADQTVIDCPPMQPQGGRHG